ncbi:MAG: DNA polymerase III subunit delta [Oscillospiraceae bacterium]|nr:DNA polymerase III subunit delta [Oscillospiraceae bacterium]
MTIENLERELKSGSLDSLYLLYGEETYFIETKLKKIKKLFGELIQGINYIQIDETNINTIYENIEMPAFGYDKKLIVIKNAGLFKKASAGTKKNASSSRDELTQYIEKNIDTIQETTVLVVIETTDTVAKNSKLLKTIETRGTACNFEKLKPIQIVSRLKAITNAYEVKVSDATLKYLIETSGTSMQVLINEIRKLIEYKGKGKEITKKDVDKLAIKQFESIIFDLTDNLGKKEIEKSLDVLKELLYNKEPIQRILITLYNHFKKLYIVKLAEKCNRNLAESLKLKPNQMFLTSKYRAQAGYFKAEELRQILEEFIELDSKYKIGLIDVNIGLESILCRYCS